MDDSYMRPDVIMEQQQQQEEEIEEIDYFDHLPDPIVVVILNKVYDARSLCRCLAVSKRFASLIPEVGSVCITMKSPKMKKPIEDGPKSRNGPKSSFKNFVCRMLTKPFSFLLNNKKLLNSSSSSSSSSSGVGFGGGSGVDVFNWVGDVLKNFHDVEMISLELPCHGGEMGMTSKSMPLLKWEAGFGKGMEGCVILGATSVVPGSGSSCSCRRSCTGLGICNEPNGENDDDVDVDEEPLFSDEELRLRIIWIISCLIASSGRHNLMKKVLAQCPNLSNAVISDAGNQGKLHMNKAQIQELRASIGIDDTTHINVNNNNNNNSQPPPEAGGGGVGATPSSSLQMGYVGNLVMMLWYVKELELPGSGKVMKGATLVVIKPESKANAGIDRVKEGDGVSLCGGFEGDKVFEEAAKALLKRKWKREYRLEVNSF